MPDTPKPLLDCLNLVTASRVSRAALGSGAVGRARALHVNRVRDIFEDRNIVAVGISEKVTDKGLTGVLSLCFYVEKKVSKRLIRAGNLVPAVMASSDGTAVFTDVKPIGRVRPDFPVKRKASPVQSGFSVGHVDATAGTIGAIVRKGKKFFVLSNSHVLAGAGLARLNDSILYPGPRDGGKLAKNIVGTLARFARFKVGGQFVNHVDAALCAIDAERLDDLDLSIHGLTGLPTTIKAKRGMVVMKRGRTTGETEGVVEDVNFRVVIDYPGVGPVGFHDQVLCSRYSKPGDSGSIVVDKASRRVVGLHFAGASGGSVFNPIVQVTKALGFTFVRA
jgi:hypothetical protein